MSVTVTQTGLDDLGRELARIDSTTRRELPRAHKKVSERIVKEGQRAVRALHSPGGSKAVAGIRATATTAEGMVTLAGTNPTLFATVYGTRSHMVYGHRISGPGPWSPWLGGGVSPEQLYGIGPVITRVADTYAPDAYADSYMDALDGAFPN